ncbi:MAG: methyltransferase small, partial [Marmoricola sp.]|nr:methyltransferase small [Marmoricola sp.]
MTGSVSGSVTSGSVVRSTDFGGLTIRSDERLLEPRDWTTMQSRWAADLLVDLPEGPVLEVCSGAGQIGLLAVVDSQRRLVCVDVEPVASAYTLENAAAAGLADRVETRTGPMQDVVAEGE